MAPVSWSLLWKVSWGIPQCVMVPDERVRFYIKRYGWQVLISDAEFPVPPVTWPPMNIQSNPRRDTSEES